MTPFTERKEGPQGRVVCQHRKINREREDTEKDQFLSFVRKRDIQNDFDRMKQSSKEKED